eukprot:TRINITY_DN10873_c0_g1_i2.p1 TRINITY_DN10873_c0_g1~~TRINITY_DN10873_c0_g1_i2.p1  ORF type:complete len:340 (-),score=43.76 TRINITY_DN10873_c0_g1_i2:131-1150(-)
MGAHASSPKSGAGGTVRSGVPKTTSSEPFAAEALDREARPARRCLPLAWSGVQDLPDELSDEDGPPAKLAPQACKEAWEPRPFSRDSTASTMSLGYQDIKFGARPGSASSRPSLPSTASGASLGRRSLSSRSSSSLASPGSKRGSRANRSAGACLESPAVRPEDSISQAGGDDPMVALTDVKLEDARQRSTKNMEALQAMLSSSRREGMPPSLSRGEPMKARSQGASLAASPSKPAAPRSQASSGPKLQASPAKLRPGGRSESPSGHVKIFVGSTERVASAETNQAPSGTSPGAPQMPAAASSLRHKERGPLPARMPAHSLGPRPQLLGQRYGDVADGV